MNKFRKKYKKIFFLQIIFFILLLKPAFSLEVIRDAEIEKLLKDYARPLFKSSNLSVKNIDIVIISDPSMNAFVTMNGRIFVNTGLLAQSKTPNEVIGILAHEIGHIKNGHAITRRSEIEKSSINNALALIAGLSATAIGINSNNHDLSRAGFGLTMGMKNSAKRNLLSYTRSQEYEADVAAVNLLLKTGQSSKGLINTLESLGKNRLLSAKHMNPYELTHASSQDRINLIKSLAISSPYYDKTDSMELLHRHNLVRAKLIAYLNYNNVNFIADNVYTQYIDVIRDFERGDLNPALEKLNILLQSDYNNPFYSELKGEILFQLKKPKEALEAFENAINLAPNEKLILNKYAEILISTEVSENIKKAIKILDDSIKNSPDNIEAYRQISIAYYKDNNIGLAELYSAYVELMTGNKKQAKIFAKRAKGKFEHMSSNWMLADDIELIN
ncbi:MAG: M48 family metalloprotease [Alphaproteobacteria bacterium]|jgi:predicted Zn-dependent protease|tara:strand:- start:8212 stop:9546 length:1335 start_codon:yes stop_codon:yes gene_type:complete